MRALPLAVICFAAALALRPAGAEGQARAPRPAEPYVDAGVCPFECCTYGRWTAEQRVAVFLGPAGRHTAPFTLAAGERFHALTGDVHLRRVGVVRVTEPVVLSSGIAGRPDVRLERGDTVYVLSYVGEGTHRVWARGRIHETPQFWAAAGDPPGRGALLHAPEPVWWVYLRNARGNRGWIRMDRAAVSGADACA